MSDLLSGILPLIFIFGTAAAILMFRDRRIKRFEAFGTDMMHFYLSPSPGKFEDFQLRAAKFRKRLLKTETNADLMASVMIARISEKYSWPILNNGEIGERATAILNDQTHLAEYIEDDKQVDLLKLDLWWVSYFATGDITFLDKLLAYAGEEIREGAANEMLINAATWSFTANCHQHDSVREFAIHSMTMSKYQSKKTFLEECVNSYFEPAVGAYLVNPAAHP